MSNSVSQYEALEAVINSFSADLHTSFPGMVVQYDASKQTATIRPMLKKCILAQDINEEEEQYEQLPDIPNVPIRHARGAKFYIHTPLEAGDFVWVHAAHQDFSIWRRTGQVSIPGVPEYHSLNACWAEPGAFTNSKALTSSQAIGSSLTMGHEDLQVEITNARVSVAGDADAAALASKVEEQLNDLKTALNGWTPVANDGGAALKVALTTWIADVASVASQKLKVGS
jgi:hypothetical protein